MTTEKPINELITLVSHSVRYPNQTMPNKPEFFGLDKATFPKKAMSLGKLKMFPEEVWADVYGSYKDSPMGRLNLIRSRLQFFIESNTFSYMNGLANALPDNKLIEFRSIVKSMEDEFKIVKELYINNYCSLVEHSLLYWREHAHLFNVTPDQMATALGNRFFKLDSLEDKFLFSVLHFEIKAPTSYDGQEIDPAIIEARQKAAEEAGKEIKESIKVFKLNVVKELRQGVMDAMEGLHQSINSGKWNQKSINSLKRYLEGIESMNLMNDNDLQQVVDDTRGLLDEYDAKSVKGKAKEQEALMLMISESMVAIDGLTDPVIQEEAIIEEAEEEMMNVGRIVDPF